MLHLIFLCLIGASYGGRYFVVMGAHYCLGINAITIIHTCIMQLRLIGCIFSTALISWIQNKYPSECLLCWRSVPGRISYTLVSGCHFPDMNFTFNGNFLDDGRIPVNNTISFECSDNRTLQSKCVIEDNSDADNGFWEPDPTVCPNITGIKYFCTEIPHK